MSVASQTESAVGEHGRSERSVIAYLAFLGVLLATGIDIALPAFDAIEASVTGATNVPLVITAYLMGMAIGQLVYGPVADSIGRRPTVLFGLALYAAGAALSALAPGFGTLLIARFCWGLGAAAPAGLRNAIARDLYRGDAMARVATIMMAVFLLGPVFIPLLGEVFVRTLPWQTVFWFPALLAAAAAVWCVRFGETLDPASRRPLGFGQLIEGARTIGRSRIAGGYLVANVFLSGAFFIFLGSAQPVFDQVYDRAAQFALLFALTGIITIPALLINNKLLERHGARRMSVITCAISCVVSLVAVPITLGAGGVPTFWLWYTWLVIAAGMLTLSTPAIMALALEPMGELAGTASSLLYFTAFAFGAALAAIFDAMVETTVTPFVVGFTLYGTIGFLFLLAAGAPSDPVGLVVDGDSDSVG